MSADFPDQDLPWTDRHLQPIDDYVAGLDLGEEERIDLRYQLLHWVSFGYLVIPGAVEPELCDALLADQGELLERYREFHTMLDSQVYRSVPIREIPDDVIVECRDGRSEIHLRLHDFIHNSIAAKRISLHPKVTGFLEHVYRDRAVAFQSLDFIVGSEQPIHQDFAYVPSNPRARLAASWVALEDVHPDAGPLEYIPGSGWLRKFDWESGNYMLPGRTKRNELEFRDHILAEAERAGLHSTTFCPKKGDAFLWSAALAHGGSPVRDRARTRRSHVTHYAPAKTHLTHVHSGGQPGVCVEYPGGFAMRHPLYPDEDDAFENGVEAAVG